MSGDGCDPELHNLAHRLRFALAAQRAHLSSEECDEEIGRLNSLSDEAVVEEARSRGVDLIRFAEILKKGRQ
jgi:hypothetical protein